MSFWMRQRGERQWNTLVFILATMVNPISKALIFPMKTPAPRPLLYLASDAACQVTGAILAVDGGLHLAS
jgi:enoyl-[acyl-carrier-protein] reductase (NADH)